MLPLGCVFPQLTDLSHVCLRRSDSVLPGVPSRHQAGRDHDARDDFPSGDDLQSQLHPLQQDRTQRPVPRRRAAGAAQLEVGECVSVEGLWLSFNNEHESLAQ